MVAIPLSAISSNHTTCQCFTPNLLAYSLHSFHQLIFRPNDWKSSCLVQTSPLSITQLAEWKLTSISEWQSTCSIRDNSPPCLCSPSQTCGPYLVADFVRSCGCRRSIEVRVNGCSEQFLFLDAFPSESASMLPHDDSVIALGHFDVAEELKWEKSDYFDSGDEGTASENGSEDVAYLTASESLSSSFFAVQEKDLEMTLYPCKDVCVERLRLDNPLRFTLVDFAVLLGAIQDEHSEHRWTESYADRSFIDFSIAEMFEFLDSFDQKERNSSLIFGFRRSIVRKFHDTRVNAGQTWISRAHPSERNILTIEDEIRCLDLEKWLLSCMKERVSFVKDELRLVRMSLTKQQCALKAKDRLNRLNLETFE